MQEVLFSIEITGAEEVANALYEAAKGLRGDRLVEPWERVVEYLAAAVREKVPFDLGDLKASIEEEVIQEDEGLMGSVFSELHYAPQQERGTDPYFPNLDNLEGWAERHGTTAWAVALAIGDYDRGRGLRPQHYMEEALEEQADTIFELIGYAVAEILEETY